MQFTGIQPHYETKSLENGLNCPHLLETVWKTRGNQLFLHDFNPLPRRNSGMNERITEEFVRSHFKSDPLFNVVKLEEQKSNNARIKALLQEASKSGKGNIGKPEFIVSFPAQNSHYLIIVECKSRSSQHESAAHNKPKDFAVDGALHYAKFFSEEFDVIAIAVSGQSEKDIKISTFKWTRGERKFIDQKTNKLLSINDYLKLFDNEYFAENLKTIDIIQKAVHLNDEFQAYSITEISRCTIVSAILLSLLDAPFKKNYPTYETASDLARELIEALQRVLTKHEVKNKTSMLGEFQKITNESLFTQSKIQRKKEERDSLEVIKEFIHYIHKNVFPLTTMDDAGMDVLGRFYTEFIRYAGSSQKQGLVLTPGHAADLFCDLASITSDSKVYDPCCGSGGFLIAAMKRMLSLAANDTKKKKSVKSNQLVGVEKRADMYTYACSNMMFRGDGKSNIYNDSCFTVADTIRRDHNPNVAFLNPPYDVGNAAQMEFFEHALNIVSDNHGIVVGIVQMSCAIKDDKELIAVKDRLLKKHRLKAVISMPDKLFDPVGVITCVMVWEANKPNEGYETWFGYLKDDGYEVRKNKGRIDVKKKWDAIRRRFLDAYYNSKEVDGLSVKRSVTVRDEWCAEAYMKTDYSSLSRTDFLQDVKKYILFKKLTEVV